MNSIIFNQKEFREKYDLSENGFLPKKCITNIPEKLSFLNIISENLTNLDGKKYKLIVDIQNEIINIENLDLNYFQTNFTTEEIKYIYSITSFMSHKYLTCDNRCDKLPKILAIPFYNKCFFFIINTSQILIIILVF